MLNLEWDAWKDLNCGNFGRKGSTLELTLITYCNLKMLSFLEKVY